MTVFVTAHLRMMKRRAFVFAFLISLFSTHLVHAQNPVLPTDSSSNAATPTDPEKIKQQILLDEKIRSTLENLYDPAVKEQILNALKNHGEDKKKEEQSLQQAIDSRLKGIQSYIGSLLTSFSNIPSETERAIQLMLADSTPTQLWLTLLFLPVLFVIGLVAEALLWRFFRPIYWRVLDVPRVRPSERLGALLFRILYAFVSVAAFAIFSLGIFLTLNWPDVSRIIIVTYLTIFIVLRITWRLTKIVFSPKAEQLRLLPIDNNSALFFRTAIGFVIGLTVLFSTTGQVLRDIGYSTNTINLYTIFTSLIIVAITSFVILEGRILLKRGTPKLAGRKMDIWPLSMVGALALGWLCQLLGFISLSSTIYVLTFLPLVLTSVESIIANAVKVPTESSDSEEKSAETQHQEAIQNATKLSGASPYELIVERALRSFIFAGAAYWVVTFWGVDVIAMTFSNAEQTPFAAAIFNVVVTLLVADLLWQCVAALIDSHLKETPIDGEHRHDMTRSEARLQTLLPILRLFIMVVVWVIAIMICLSTLGVNIGPLLAGAGVVGIAIGFGAQTLVRDIFSGIFFLLDDAFRVGEYIESGNIRGTVEAMSLRSLRLRHHRGALHTVPFGDLKAITNQSRDWVIMKLELGLTYDTDLELVRKTVKEIGKMMLSDPDVGPHILEPLKSQGVNRLGDFNLIVRVKFKCRPGEQFVARRLAYKLIQEIFPQRGIKFAFPTVTIAGHDNEKSDEAMAAKIAIEAIQKQPAT